MKTRRKTTRVYRINAEQSVHISKEWSMKFGQNLYYVTPWPADGRTLTKVPTFAEAKQFVRTLEAY
jgi:hypothetical protein